MDERKNVIFHIRRQADGRAEPTWDEFSVPWQANATVASCLQWLAVHPTLASGQPTSPPAWEANCLEESCGACAILINGRVQQACSARIDQLPDTDEPIKLAPMSKFPVIRDLVVDRARFSADLRRIKAWIPIDGAYDLGPGPQVSPAARDRSYRLSQCTQCGCCLEACPQYARNKAFIGAALISQTRLFNEHRIGAELKSERLQEMMKTGGVHDCAKAANCVAVCPKEIPLMESIAAVERQVTAQVIKEFFSS
jgi:succinate dehydrogenase / fumarate reductase, iron-sulfur subunit